MITTGANASQDLTGYIVKNNIDDCASNPCSNQAICQDEVNKLYLQLSARV